MGIFGGGGFFGGGGIRGENLFERQMKKKTRRAIEKVATNIHPTLGSVVKVVNDVQEAKDNLFHGELPEVLDNSKLREGTIPIHGSVVYCELGAGLMDHSGIYVGGNQIIDLGGKGNIKRVSCQQFTAHVTTVDTAIWVPCDRDGQPVGLSDAAWRAEEMVGEKRNYNLILDNCHQFSSGCVTGNFENADNFLWMLKDTFAKRYGEKINWKRWDYR